MITSLLLASTPSPSSTAAADLDADLVTPGLWGFLVLFFLALAVYLLGRSMARRVQRVNLRARLAEEERAQAAAGEAEAAAAQRVRGDSADGEPPVQT